MLILNITTIVCIGLMIGVEFAVSAFVNPVLWKLESGAQMHAVRLFAAKLGFVMPFWYALGLLLLLAETFFHWRQPHVLLLTISIGIWALVIILTLLFLVPINNRLARIEDPSSFDNARSDHHKWDTLHRLRILALAIAMVLALIAIVH
jgi:uncharacterized membrane protein